MFILGGTVDITAHEKTDDGNLIELCRCTGDEIGATEVDKNFLNVFREIVGEEIMHSLLTEDEYKDSYFDILREIENFKRTVFASTSNSLLFNVPFSRLDTLCKKCHKKSLSETISSSKYSNEISMKRERIVFHRSSLSFLFLPVVNRILTMIRRVIEDLKDYQIKMILLSGGLSTSPVIVKKIEKSFEGMKIITVPQMYPPDLAVVKGAVLYGHNPQFITSRITDYTYGRLVQPLFEIGTHDPAKLITINGIDLCKDVFDTLVQKNERVGINDKIRKEYQLLNTSQTQIRISVYTTQKDKVDYVDDAECRLFCEIKVPLSFKTAIQPACVVVDFIFGYTEFHISAFEKETGDHYAVSVELK